MKKKNQLAEDEIDELIISQAEDDGAWEAAVTVEGASALLERDYSTDELAIRVSDLASASSFHSSIRPKLK